MSDNLLSRIEAYHNRLRDSRARQAVEEAMARRAAEAAYEEDEEDFEEEYDWDEYGEEPEVPDEIHFDEMTEIINGHTGWDVEDWSTNLLRYSVSPDNPWYFEIDGVVFSRETGLLVLFPPGKGEVYTIPDDDRITGIGFRAFCRNSLLKEIIWNDRIRYIEAGAFENCSAIQRITLPETVEYIGRSAFEDCISLKKAELNGRFTSLAERLFYRDTALESVRYPGGVTSLCSSAFSGCTALKDMRPSGDENRDYDVVTAQGITEIGREAFNGCTSISSVLLSENMKTIGRNAFMGCVSLKKIPAESVRIYHGNCFKDCTSLEQFAFSRNTRHLGREIFAGADGLKSIRFSCAPGFDSDPYALPEEMEYTVDTEAYLAAGKPFNCKPLFHVCVRNLAAGEQVPDELLESTLRILRRNRNRLYDWFYENEEILAFILKSDFLDCDGLVHLLKAAETGKPEMVSLIREHMEKRFSEKKTASAFAKWEKEEQERKEAELKEKRLQEERERLKELRIRETWERLQQQKKEILEGAKEGEDILIDHMQLSLRAHNCLERHGIRTLSELSLMAREDFFTVRNMGRKSMEEVIEKIELLTGRKVPDERDDEHPGFCPPVRKAKEPPVKRQRKGRSFRTDDFADFDLVFLEDL